MTRSLIFSACALTAALLVEAHAQVGPKPDPKAPALAPDGKPDNQPRPQAEPESPASGKPVLAPKKDEPDPTLEVLKKLKPEQQERIKKDVNEASTFVGTIRLAEALQKLDEAEQIAPDLFMVHNLKGAVFTKMRVFDKARASFVRAGQLNPGSFHPKFNLAEIDFVEHHWDKAQSGFEALLTGNADESTKKLMQFKIVICLLQQDKIAEAEKIVKGFSYLDDDPVFYMGHAAIEFQKKNKDEAQSYIDSANRIYTGQILTIYMDSFIEVGWVETLAL